LFELPGRSQGQSYEQAGQNDDAGDYEQSCETLHHLYASTDGYRDLSKSIIESEKRTGTSNDWQTKAYDSDNRHTCAKECLEWYRAAILQAGFVNFDVAGNDDEHAERAVKNLRRQRGAQNKGEQQPARADAQPTPTASEEQTARKSELAGQAEPLGAADKAAEAACRG
jgi:hypothetical protein